MKCAPTSPSFSISSFPEANSVVPCYPETGNPKAGNPKAGNPETTPSKKAQSETTRGIRSIFCVCVLPVAICLFFSTDLVAQSKSSKSRSTAKRSTERKSTAKKSSKRGTTTKKDSSSKSRTRLPRYFTHLKLTEEQREDVRQLQAKQKKEMETMLKQLEELREEHMDNLEDLLSRTQKTLLNKYKAGTLKVGEKTGNQSQSKSASSSGKKSTRKSSRKN